MEELRYLPSIDLCLVTRGTLQNGNPSRASIWTSTKIRQHSNDRRYYLYRDTYDHVNPLIYSRPHLTEYTEYYLKKLTEFSQHHRDNLFKNLKRKKLHGPYVTTLQQFDACRHRKIFAQYNVLVPAYMETAWEAIIDNQCAAYDKKISFTEQ